LRLKKIGYAILGNALTLDRQRFRNAPDLIAAKGNASQEVLLLRGWLKISARAKYRFADD
jgi:hypothetical protein